MILTDVWIIIILISFLKIVNAKRSSPCPDILKYEARKEDEIDKWTGIIALKTDEQLEGLWIRIILDSEANLLMNWLGDVSTRDNIEFTIQNQTWILNAGVVLNLKIQVLYNPVDVAPSIITIQLNGHTICTDTSKPIVNRPVRPIKIPSPIFAVETPSRNTEESTTRRDDGSDFFPGDLPLFNDETPENTTVYTGDIECGIRAKKGIALISHGTVSKHGDWPWHVALFHKSVNESKYICGGTLLNRDYVLTAAHCVILQDSGRTSTRPLNARDILIYLGKSNLNKAEFSQQGRRISKIIMHPNFNNTYLYEDLALLKVSKPVDITDFVRPACLWSNGTAPLVGKYGMVVGWGYDQTQRTTRQLQEIQIPFIDKETCIYSIPDFFNRYTSKTSYCAGYRNETTVCNGDSGGGMFFSQGSNENTTWHMRGIVSVSYTSNRVSCDLNSYKVFTDVAYHIEWIKEQIRK